MLMVQTAGTDAGSFLIRFLLLLVVDAILRADRGKEMGIMMPAMVEGRTK